MFCRFVKVVEYYMTQDEKEKKLEKRSPEPNICSVRGVWQKGKEHVGYCVVSVLSSAITQSFFAS